MEEHNMKKDSPKNPINIRLMSISRLRDILAREEPENLPAFLISMKTDLRQGVRNLARVWDRKITKRGKELSRRLELLEIEQSLLKKGNRLIAGVDEAGCGPLAGPVVAAAVVFPAELFNYGPALSTDDFPSMRGLDDSKKLVASQRELLYDEIGRTALSWSVNAVQADEIDRLNILQARLLAMSGAIEGLSLMPDIVIVDGNRTPDCPSLKDNTRVIPITKGDRLSLSIAAASILAKVTRDRIMTVHHEKYPHYGFARHKGYGTQAHFIAIRRHGLCPIHRRSFCLNGMGDLKLRNPLNDLVKGLSLAGSEMELKRAADKIQSSRDELSDREIRELRNTYRKRKAYLQRMGRYDSLALSSSIRAAVEEPSPSTVSRGRKGEDIAVQYLKSEGYRILERNYRVRGGEIDLIAELNNVLVFVEVKMDLTKTFGEPEIWVTKKKQRYIISAAKSYLYKHGITDQEIRFDVITICPGRKGPPIHHLRAAFVEETS